MKKMLILVMVFLLVACTAEETKQQNVEQEQDTSVQVSEVEVAPQLFGNAQRIGELVVVHDYAVDVLVEQDGYDHVPKAFHLLIANESDEVQDLSFLNSFEVVASKIAAADTMMTIPTEHPEKIEPQEVLSLFVLAYSSSFDYSEMQMLKFNEAVYFEVAPFAGEIDQEEASSQQSMLLEGQGAVGDAPIYNIETLVTYDCPELPVEAVCKKDANKAAYSFTYGNNPVELYYEDEQLAFAAVTFESDLLELYFDNEQVTHATWNGEVISVFQWIQICAMQLLQLEPLLQPESLQVQQKAERFVMSHSQIEHYIAEVVRPAYERSEKAINSGSLQPTKNGDVKMYTLENLRKQVHPYGNTTYSALYIDDALVFILQIEPNGELVRYYFKDGQLVRILFPNGTIEEIDVLDYEEALKGIVR